MFCKECGTENIKTQVECIKCKTIINSNLPLDGTERVMVIGFFVGLVATIFFGIIPIIICLGLIFIIKKDKSIKSLESGKKIFLGYLIILGFILSISCFVIAQENYERYLRYLSSKHSLFNREDYIFYAYDGDYIYYAYNYVGLGLIVIPIVAYIIFRISNILYFNILKKHEEWIINNGIFADFKGEKSFIEKATEKIQTIQTIQKESTNTADELLKWAELKEKGLITDEEFQKGKEKILEGKL